MQVKQGSEIVYKGTAEMCGAFAAGALAGRTNPAPLVIGPELCACGPLRVEVVAHPDDETFLPRVGCRCCNNWDGPPVLRGPSPR